MSKVYIAAPFFNADQLLIVENIKLALEDVGLEYFSPKDESMFKQGDDPKEILNLNCKAINECSLIVVVTDDKDVGTIWEAGYAYARGKKVLYVWLGYKPYMKFNLMLGASGKAVHDYVQLHHQLDHYKRLGILSSTNTEGMLYE